MYSACAVLYCNLRPVPLYHISPHYIINGTIFVKKLFNKNMRLLFPLQRLPKTFLILRILRHTITNVRRCSCKVAIILVRFQWNLNFLGRFSKNTQISNFTKLRPVGADLFHEGGRNDRHDAANSRFSQFCERAWNSYNLTCLQSFSNAIPGPAVVALWKDSAGKSSN